MVLLEFIFMARTENVDSISMPENGDWHLKIKCTHCNENYPKEVNFSRLDEHEVIKETVNFHAKCKNCERKGTIAIVPKSPYKVKPDEHGNIKQPIACMDCRGIDIVEVVLGNSLTVVVAESFAVHENADFTDLWCQYDQKTSKVAQVENPAIEIVPAK